VKIEKITGGWITNIAVYPWDNSYSGRVPTSIVKISHADVCHYPALVVEMFQTALRALSSGFYTLVYTRQGQAVDFYVGKRGGIRVRPFDGRTINSTKQGPCLRIEVNAPPCLHIEVNTGRPRGRKSR
jgi:hypothetical protein